MWLRNVGGVLIILGMFLFVFGNSCASPSDTCYCGPFPPCTETNYIATWAGIGVAVLAIGLVLLAAFGVVYFTRIRHVSNNS
jgi:hypothetical protein